MSGAPNTIRHALGSLHRRRAPSLADLIDTSAHPERYLRDMYGAPADQRRPQIAAGTGQAGQPQP